MPRGPLGSGWLLFTRGRLSYQTFPSQLRGCMDMITLTKSRPCSDHSLVTSERSPGREPLTLGVAAGATVWCQSLRPRARGRSAHGPFLVLRMEPLERAFRAGPRTSV